MSTTNALPQIEDRLPRLMGCVDELFRAIREDEVKTTSEAQQRILVHFDAGAMQELTALAPSWADSISHDAGGTLAHVILTLTSLPLHPEFMELAGDERNILRWTMLYHDIAKRSEAERDSSHAFRSAVELARNLPAIGLDLPAGYAERLEAWAELTCSATVLQPGTERVVQDNDRLPEILSELGRLLGADSPAATAVALVLLHHSIDTLADWPQANPVAHTRVPTLIRRRLLHLLQIVMLADNDGWELFNLENCARYRTETRQAFSRLAALPLRDA